jgi:hypothetical protein
MVLKDCVAGECEIASLRAKRAREPAKRGGSACSSGSIGAVLVYQRVSYHWHIEAILSHPGKALLNGLMMA